MAAPFVITDPGDREREIVLLLADFSFTSPEEIYEQLRSRQVKARPQKGHDLNDVRYDAFLANGRTFADHEIVDGEPGESVRLRIINASSMSAYYLRLGALEGELIAVGGRSIQPIKRRVFPLTVAQRADVRLKNSPKPRKPPDCRYPRGRAKANRHKNVLLTKAYVAVGLRKTLLH